MILDPIVVGYGVLAPLTDTVTQYAVTEPLARFTPSWASQREGGCVVYGVGDEKAKSRPDAGKRYGAGNERRWNRSRALKHMAIRQARKSHPRNA